MQDKPTDARLRASLDVHRQLAQTAIASRQQSFLEEPFGEERLKAVDAWAKRQASALRGAWLPCRPNGAGRI
jgi:hypothetical protein